MTIEVVREFHVAVGRPAPELPLAPVVADPCAINDANKLLYRALLVFREAAAKGCQASSRLALETEELWELSRCLEDGDVVGALDAQVDRRYIADGTTLELGMAGVFYEAFERVHRANMAKLGPDGKPIVDATGKVRKPEGWVAPDLADLVRREL